MTPPPFDALWFQLLVGLVTGLCLGSFITMLSYRLPKHLSIVQPPSHCPSCEARLKAVDLIPVLSWLVARGRCRYCRNPIGGRYVAIEIVSGIACAGAFGWLGFELALVWALMAIVVTTTSVVIIIEHKPFMGDPPSSL